MRKLSFSQYSTYLRCPKLYEFKYVLWLKEPPKPALAFGSALHKGLAWAFQEKIKTGNHPPLNALIEKTWDAIDMHIGKIPNFADNVQKMKENASKLLSEYDAIRTALTPVSVERDFVITSTSLTSPMMGRIDLETENNGGIEITDHKTASWEM